MGNLVASVLQVLLVIVGVEINPGPLIPNEFVGNSTAEISHFLNEWYLNKMLVISGGLRIYKIEMDYSWAMIHSV